MADTVTFGDYTYTNNEAGYNQFVSDMNAGKLHVTDLGNEFFNSENKLDDYLLDNFKDKNLSIVTYRGKEGYFMKIVDPNNAAEVEALKNIKICDINGNGAIDVNQYSHGTWEEEDTLTRLINKGGYYHKDAVIIHNNTPNSSELITADTDNAAERGAKSADVTNAIISGQGRNVNLHSEGYSLGNWHNLNNLKNIDFSKLGADGKINICMDSLPSFGPFTTSIDEHVAAFKELCKDPEFVKHLGNIDFYPDDGTGIDNKFHPPKATAEFWDKCMEDPEVKKILEEHTTQETKDKIAHIDRNEKSYWDKLQMGIIVAVAVIAVITIVAICVHLYRKHKKKQAQKKAEQLLQNTPNQNTENPPTAAQPVMYYPVMMPANYQPYYNLQNCAQQQVMNQGNAAQNYQNYYQQYQQQYMQQYQQMISNNQQPYYNMQSVNQTQGQWR